MTGWRVTFDRGTAFVAGPKSEARRRLEACHGSPVWVNRRSAWATSPAAASAVLDQLEARRIPAVVENADQTPLDLSDTEPANTPSAQESLW